MNRAIIPRMKPMPTRSISVAIHCPVQTAYDFILEPSNLSKWASGIDDSIHVRFADRNTWGVVDHYATLPSGVTFYNPMRVIQNGDGCEVTFTLFRHPEMTAEKLEEDTRWIEKDLHKLKSLLEAAV